MTSDIVALSPAQDARLDRGGSAQQPAMQLAMQSALERQRAYGGGSAGPNRSILPNADLSGPDVETNQPFKR